MPKKSKTFKTCPECKTPRVCEGFQQCMVEASAQMGKAPTAKKGKPPGSVTGKPGY